MTPAVDLIAAEIADLKALIEARPARAQTLRPLVLDLREPQGKLQREARRKANASLIAQIPAEAQYRSAVAEFWADW